MLLNVGAGGAAAEAEALPLSDDAGGDTRRALDCVTVPRRPPKARSRSISASWARSEKCDDGGGDVPAFTSREEDRGDNREGCFTRRDVDMGDNREGCLCAPLLLLLLRLLLLLGDARA